MLCFLVGIGNLIVFSPPDWKNVEVFLRCCVYLFKPIIIIQNMDFFFSTNYKKQGHSFIRESHACVLKSSCLWENMYKLMTKKIHSYNQPLQINEQHLHLNTIMSIRVHQYPRIYIYWVSCERGWGLVCWWIGHISSSREKWHWASN